MAESVFDRIARLKDTATRREKVIIECLKDIRAEDIIYYSITEFAGLIGAAEATTLRFCQRFEFKGFWDFSLIRS